jgi:hypothetical protein
MQSKRETYLSVRERTAAVQTLRYNEIIGYTVHSQRPNPLAATEKKTCWGLVRPSAITTLNIVIYVLLIFRLVHLCIAHEDPERVELLALAEYETIQTGQQII